MEPAHGGAAARPRRRTTGRRLSPHASPLLRDGTDSNSDWGPVRQKCRCLTVLGHGSSTLHLHGVCSVAILFGTWEALSVIGEIGPSGQAQGFLGWVTGRVRRC